jgi:hypothetical protein
MWLPGTEAKTTEMWSPCQKLRKASNHAFPRRGMWFPSTERKPLKCVPLAKSSENVQIGHSVIYDCTWNGIATKTWNRKLPEGVPKPRSRGCQTHPLELPLRPALATATPMGEPNPTSELVRQAKNPHSAGTAPSQTFRPKASKSISAVTKCVEFPHRWDPPGANVLLLASPPSPLG